MCMKTERLNLEERIFLGIKGNESMEISAVTVKAGNSGILLRDEAALK
jgi:hypothetical protein